MTRHAVLLAALIVGFVWTGEGAFAQSQYDEKALRVKVTFGGTKIVAGVNADEVAKVGMFPSRDLVPILSERSEEAAELYLQFRTRQIQISILTWSGLALIVAALLVGEDNEGVGLGLAVGGLALGVVGLARLPGTTNRFHQSIWGYNRTFASE